MIRIGILGDIGSGKSFVAKQFGFPVFDADLEVGKIYKKNRTCFLKLKKKLPMFIKSFPIKKTELSKAILSNNKSIKIIINIVHPIVRNKMWKFIKKNSNKKAVVLDIPLLIENKLYKKKDILIFVDAKRKDIELRLKKRFNYNKTIFTNLRKSQKSLSFKKKLSSYTIKNNFKFVNVKKKIKLIKSEILND